MTFTRRHFIAASVLTLVAAALSLGVARSTAQAAIATTTPLATAAIDQNSDPLAAESSPVYAIAEANGRYYIGGNFQTVAGETQPYLAAIDVATGRLDQQWRPQVNGEVRSIAVAPDGSAVYVGGKFFKINNSFPARIAKLDPTTGAVDNTFDPDTDAVVNTIATDGANVWIGGAFTTVGGVVQPHLAKISSAGVVDTAFAPVLDGNIIDVELEGSRLFLGGNFTTIDGASHKRIASVNPTTGAADPWTPESNFKVYDVSMKPDGTILYAAGAGSLGAGGNSLTAWDTATGQQLWRRVNSGDFQAVVATDDLVYIGTHGDYVFDSNDGPFLEDDANPNAIPRSKLAAFDPITGALDPWNPGANSTWGVWELSIGPSGLAVGGDFTTIGGVVQPHFAVLEGPGLGNKSPVPVFDFFCTTAGCFLDGTGSSDPDGSIASYQWDLGNGRTETGPAVSNIVPATIDDFNTVTLTVTDNGGATASTQRKVLVDGTTRTPLPVEVVDTVSTSGQGTLTSPGASSIDAGDYAIAIVTVADTSTTITPPPGWTEIGTQNASSLKSIVFANPSPSSIVEDFVSDKPGVKGTLTLSVFRHADPAIPVQVAVEAEPSLSAEHTAPAITTTSAATVAHYWANRSTNGVSLAAPADEATISTEVGIGGGHVNSTMSITSIDAAGTSPARIAVGDLHTRSALGWTIALTQGQSVPTCVATLTGDDTVFLDWSDVRQARSYTVRRDGSWLTTLDGDLSEHLDNPGVGTFTYEVRAPIDGGGRVDVPCTPAITVDAPPPAVQTCTATLNADDSISLAWDAIAGENAYSIRRNGKYLTFVGNALTFAESPGTGTWDYAIRSTMNGVKTTTPCNPTAIVVDGPAPVAQTCTATLNGDNTISLAWTPIVGENSYNLRRNGAYVGELGNTLSSIQDPGAGTWTYEIRSTKAGVRTSTVCNPIDVVIGGGNPPAGQSCATSANADGSVTLTWDAIAGENDPYVVRRNDAWLDTVDALTYTDAFAQAGDTYVIRSRENGVTTNTPCA